MRIRRLFIIALLLCTMGLSKAFAYDFSAVCETGQTLYYNIIDDTNRYVALTYPNSSSSFGWNGWNDFTKPTGEIVLPPVVSNEGISYYVTKINDYAFYYCSGLTGTLVIPDFVTSIGESSFSSCSGLASVTIGNSVFEIGSAAFSWCTGLTSITTPNSVTSIGHDAFAHCTGITSITIPDSVTTIENSVFSGCSGLASITLPNSVTSIGNYAFSECNGLASITLPNSVTSIGNYAFSGCKALTSIIIPSPVSSIGDGVFSLCDNLNNIIVESGNPNYDSRNNCNAIIETISNSLIVGCKNTIIPQSVTIIGDYAFSGCEGLTSIIIPPSVITIGNHAFYGTSIDAIDIPNSVESIGKFAFSECKNLTSLIIPDSVTSIGIRAFKSCSGLESVTIGNSITNIGLGAFSYCKSLKSITIPKSVTYIGVEVFTSCDNLEEIIIEGGNSVYDSRNNCNAIVETHTNKIIAGCKNSFIPNSITIIGEEAFYECRDLSSIIIPNTVSSIESWAFKGTTMTSVVALGVVPPTLGGSAFGRNGNLIVVCSSKEAYENSDWNNYFEDIEEECGSYSIFKATSGSNGASGSIVSLPNYSQVGGLVCFSLIPNSGCHVESVKIQKADNPFQTIPITQETNDENSYSFVMPPFPVSVRAVFAIGNATDENMAIPIAVYPNPTSGQIKLESEDIKHISISNMVGQLVYEGNAEGDSFEYDFSDYKAGIYLIRITTSAGIATKRIVVTQ